MLTIENTGEVPTAYIVEVTGISALGLVPQATARTPTPVILPGMARDVRVAIPIPPDVAEGSWDAQVRIYEAGPEGSLGNLVDEQFFGNVLDVEVPERPPAPRLPEVPEIDEDFAPPEPPMPPPRVSPRLFSPSEIQRLEQLDPTGRIQEDLGSVNRIRDFIRQGGVATHGVLLSPDEYLRFRELDPFRRVTLDYTGEQLLEFIRSGGQIPASVEAARERAQAAEAERIAEFQAGLRDPFGIRERQEEAEQALAEIEAREQERFAQRFEEAQEQQRVTQTMIQAAQLTVDQARNRLSNVENELAQITDQLNVVNQRTEEVAARIDEYDNLGFFEIIPPWWAERFGLRRPTIDEVRSLFDQLRTEAGQLRQQRSQLFGQVSQAREALSQAEFDLRQLR